MCSWSIVAADMNKKVGDELIKLIVEEWVKIRGFSFAGSWLELYKQRNKKNTAERVDHTQGLRVFAELLHTGVVVCSTSLPLAFL